MTQDGLAAGRFTKQYVSQIERGEIVPSGELLEWLASRLGVETLQLQTGLSSTDLERVEGDLERGSRLLDEHRYAEALDTFRALRASLAPGAPRSTERSAVRGEVWALIRLGRPGEAADLLGEARSAAEGPDGSALERAEVAYLTAVCCWTLSQIPAAQVEFGRALELLEASDEKDDRLRIEIYSWRTRCFRRLHDWEAAHEDIERALDLCRVTDDPRLTADVTFQASIVSYRLGSWVLARRQAETARGLYAEVGDVGAEARVLNNLANLNELLGNADVAIEQHREAFRMCVDAGLDAEAGYVLSSLAEIHRGRGELDEAELAARRALDILGSRVDHIQEVGNAQLVLARARLEQGALDQAEDLLGAADESFSRADSISHRAQSWMARGELQLLRENDAEAARLFREAAIALQSAEA
jgi:HTH-type transcriptional regulator, quorum sensing regulator NprR